VPWSPCRAVKIWPDARSVLWILCECCGTLLDARCLSVEDRTMADSEPRGDDIGWKQRRGVQEPSRRHAIADPRQRLIEALIAEVSARGYRATSVPQLLRRSGVSHKVFSEHFPDRQQLLLAAFDEASASTLGSVRSAVQRSGGGTRQLEKVMRHLCRAARDAPGAMELCTGEVLAAGTEGIERRQALMDDYGEIVQRCLAADTRDPPLPPALPPLLCGAVCRTVDARLRTGRAAELSAIALALARWVRSYHPVPPTVAQPRDPSTPNGGWMSGNGHFGGRAPGTLTLAPPVYTPAGVKHVRGLQAHAHRELILDAVAHITARESNVALSTVSIGAFAELSPQAVHAQFASPDDALSAAFELGHTKAQAVIARARETAPTWRAGVSHAVVGLLDFLASEPLYTHMAYLSAPLAGPRMAVRQYQHVRAYAQLLLHGAPQRRRPPTIAPEAIVHALFEIAFVFAATGRTAELPAATEQATYIALAPYLGVTEAARTAS
jgi:AcrR family transcriptional regulator